MSKKAKYLVIIIPFIGLMTYLIRTHCSTQQYARLEIPKIKLKENIYDKDSKDNNLNKGLLLLKESNYLEENPSKMFIASHSGTAKISYFKNLDKIKIGDEIKIKKDNVFYLYKVTDIYEEENDGNISVKNYDQDYVALITCDKANKDKQLVVIGVSTGELNHV